MMSPPKSRRNVSPDPQTEQIKFEKKLVESLRREINKWPENFLKIFNDINKEVDVDGEVLKMFEVLVQVKRDLDEDIEGQRQPEAEKHKVKIVKCLHGICETTPYLLNEFINVLKKHDQYVAEVINFRLRGKVDYQPECAVITNSPPFSVMGKDIQPKCAAVPHSSSKCNVKFWAILGSLLAVIVSVSLMKYISALDIKIDEPNKIEEWTQNIKDLQEKFPSQNEKVWYNILSGVKTIVTEKPTKPSVLLLLHNDKKTSACLANKVGKEAVKLLSDSLQEPIIIQGEDLKLNESLAKDYGLFTASYKDDIEKKHVMIVLDLQEVPGMVAQTFHVLCDVENPLVRNAAFLFTMEVDEKLKQQPTKIAEDYLSRLWKNSLPSDIMDPLITRITDAVVSIKMESHLPC